jgi:opacity protein-like surface antigen
MKKMFLTMALALIAMVSSAQFMVVTTMDQPADGEQWEVSNLTNNIGVGYQMNDKMTLGVVKNGEEYDLWGRYNISFMYLAVQAPTDSLTDNMTFGVGYSLRVWNDLYIDPSYMVSTKEDSEGEFRVGLSYKL